MKKTSKLSAFTLIELLIVIAIIGILATLMFPAIQGALNKANGVKIGNNGANIVKSILQTNIDLEAMSKPSIWPSSTSSSYGQVANEYFAWLMDNEYLDGVSFTFFAGAGVGAASDASTLKTGDYNIWDITADVDNADDALPFMWTRNLELTKDLIHSFKADDTTSKFTLTGDIKPFGDVQVVLARKGGAMQTIRKKYLYQSDFMGGVTNGSVEVFLTVTKSSNSGGNTTP